MLTGHRALLVGGSAMVTGRITAGVIGSKMATATELEVGHDPSLLETYKHKVDEFNEIKKEYDNNSKEITTMRAMDEKGTLDERHKENLLRKLHIKASLETKLKALADEIGSLRKRLDTVTGMVSAEQTIHCGVNVLIGNAALYVRDDISSCSLVNEGGKIVVKNFVKES
jgi:uncharacterized protein (DUF342 family)